MDETRSGLIAKLEFGPLEFKIFRLYTTKTKYKEGKFSKTRSKYKKMVRFDGRKIQKIKNFWYLRSIIHKDQEIKDDVNYGGWIGEVH